MVIQTDSHVLLMGLPATGKTSFLAALWYLVQHQQVKSRFRIERFEGDSTYLNQITKAWAEYELVPRTPVRDSVPTVSMVLRDTKSGQTLTLTFPDLSGESFALQWLARQCTHDYDSFLRKASGAILFVTPLNYQRPIRIDMVNSLAEQIINGEPKPVPPQDPTLPIKPWDPISAPTQVQLVEILQFISSRDYFKPVFRLVVVVSAWDQLVNEKESPSEWIAKTFPLLNQFLESNKGTFETAVYGVSAQGADYSEAAKLAEMVPSERINVTGVGIDNPHDLTEPLLWLTR